MRVENLSHPVRRTLGLPAGALVLSLVSGASMAAIVCSPAAVPVPASLDGVYLNLVTGGTGSTGPSLGGWDINLYQTGSPAALYFFWPTPAASAGGVATGTVYDRLESAAPIGPAQTYSQASAGGGPANFVNWQTTTANTTGHLGIRFLNEATSTTNYGWLDLDTGAGNGFPATIAQYCYDNTCAQITTGTTPVTLQQFSVD